MKIVVEVSYIYERRRMAKAKITITNSQLSTALHIFSVGTANGKRSDITNNTENEMT